MMTKDVAIRAVGNWPSDSINAQGDIVLGDDDMKLLSSVGKVKHYQRHEVIAEEGEPGGRIWLVLQGLACVSHMDRDGRRTIIVFRWHGDLFGLTENAVFVNNTRAVTELTAMEFDRAELETVLLHTPALQNALFVKVTADLRQAQNHARLLAGKSASCKLASFLVEFSRYPSCYDAARSVLRLPVARLDVADYLGMTLETVSRALAHLSRRNLIHRLDSRQIKVNIPALIQFSGYE